MRLGDAITLDVIAFIALACAFAVYGLYASAASLRDVGAAHESLGPANPRFLANAGVSTASFAAIGLFLTPWLAREGGYPAAATALIGVSVPLAATLLAPRGWALARLIGANGTGEMLAKLYGNGPAIVCGLIVASASAILLALILAASASLFEAVSAGAVSQPVALHLTGLFLLLSGAPAGIRAAGRLARFHTGFVLIGAGAALVLTVVTVGGTDATLAALAHVGDSVNWGTTGGRGGGDYDLALAVPGAFGPGTIWSGTTILSVQITLGGTVLGLIWLPRNMASGDPRRFSRQITFAAVFGGAALIVTTFMLGLVTLEIDKDHISTPVVPFPGHALSEDSIARIIDTIADERFWSASALLGLGAGAALHAVALSLMATTVSALRPLWTRRSVGTRTTERNLAASQATAAALVVAAVLLAYLPTNDLAALSAIALSLAPLVILPFVAACWLPNLSRSGLTAGLICGIAVTLTDALDAETAVHAASFSLIVATLVAAVVSRLRRADSKRALRRDSHDMLNRIFAGVNDHRPLDQGMDAGRKSMATLGIAIWIFFAIGPGIVIGNDVFGAPDLPRNRWDFSIPSIAVWQILAWAAGAVLIRFLVGRLGLAEISREQLDQITAQRDRKNDGR